VEWLRLGGSDGALVVEDALDVVDIEAGEADDRHDLPNRHPQARFCGHLLLVKDVVDACLLHLLLDLESFDLSVSLLKSLIHALLFSRHLAKGDRGLMIILIKLDLLDDEAEVLQVASRVRKFDNVSAQVVILDYLHDVEHFSLPAHVLYGQLSALFENFHNDGVRLRAQHREHRFHDSWLAVDPDHILLGLVGLDLSRELVTRFEIVHKSTELGSVALSFDLLLPLHLALLLRHLVVSHFLLRCFFSLARKFWSGLTFKFNLVAACSRLIIAVIESLYIFFACLKRGLCYYL